MSKVFEVRQGTSPVVLAFPHTGTDVPSNIWDRLNDNGKLLADTDWHIHELYAGLLPDATTVRATFHRYVIDANRDPSGHSLYTGQNTTDLVPGTDFDVKSIHGVAVLYDCHSIRSLIPFLFDGTLPDFNIGTDSGRTCDARIEAAAKDVAAGAEGYTHVLNGRFKGGWTTRHYGKPATGVHAIQMELAQITHLQTEAPPFAYDAPKADRLRIHLKTILTKIEAIALELKN